MTKAFFGCQRCKKLSIVVVPSYNSVPVKKQDPSTVYSRQILHFIKKVEMENLCKWACGCLPLILLNRYSVGQTKHSAAFVLLSKISTTQNMDLSNTFLAAVLRLKARKFIPYLSSAVFLNRHRTKHDVHCLVILS